MSRRWMLITGLLTATLMGVGGTLAARRLGSPAETVTEKVPLPLTVADDALDFGEVWESSTRTIELPVVNRSGAAVTVTDWARSCSCLSAVPNSFTLSPGQSRTVRVALSFATSPLDPSASEAKREFQTNLTALSGTEAVAERWVVRGRIKAVFGQVPRDVDMGVCSDSAKDAPTNEFEISPTVPLQSVTGVLDPPIGSVTIRPVGDRLKVTVTLRRTETLGESKAVLRFLPVGVDGQDLPAREVPVVCRVVPDVQPRYPRVVLGALREGETATGEFELYSLTGTPFDVLPIAKLPDGVTIQPRPESDRTVFDVSVKAVAGPQTTPVEFRLRQAGRKDYTVAAEVVYHGTK